MRPCWWQEVKWKGNLMFIAVFHLSRVMAFWWRFWDECRWTTMTSNNDNSNKDDEHLAREREWRRERVREWIWNLRHMAHGAIWRSWQVFDRIADRFQRLFSSSSDKAVMKQNRRNEDLFALNIPSHGFLTELPWTWIFQATQAMVSNEYVIPIMPTLKHLEIYMELPWPTALRLPWWSLRIGCYRQHRAGCTPIYGPQKMWKIRTKPWFQRGCLILGGKD